MKICPVKETNNIKSITYINKLSRPIVESSTGWSTVVLNIRVIMINSDEIYILNTYIVNLFI